LNRRFFEQETPLQGRDAASHEFINPLALYLDHAPAWYLPAAFPYCYPITVLEWNFGHVFVLSPVAKLESLISHYSHPSSGHRAETLPLIW
jgi:hypothetical protein